MMNSYPEAKRINIKAPICGSSGIVKAPNSLLTGYVTLSKPLRPPESGSPLIKPAVIPSL